MTPPDQPKGTSTPISYRVLAMPEVVERAMISWNDYGLWPGASREAALKKAGERHGELKQKGIPQVAVPETYFEVVTREVQVIEKERFVAVDPTMTMPPVPETGEAIDA
jgi:hypothetical protein